MFVVLCGLIFSWTILMSPEMTGRVSSVSSSHFQSSLGSLWTDHGHGTPLGSCLNLRQMIPKDRTPLLFTVLSVLLWGVREAHSLGGLITDVLGPDGLQRTLTFKVPICLANGDVEGNDKLCGQYASHSTKYLNRECDVLMEDANNPHASCQRTSASTISNHVASNNRKELQCQGYHRQRLPAPSWKF
jgi:hypothetical protein